MSLRDYNYHSDDDVNNRVVYSDTDVSDTDVGYSDTDVGYDTSVGYSDIETDVEETNENDIDTAFEFIKGIEDINIKQFPKYIIKKYKNKTRDMTKDEFIKRLKFELNTNFNTRLSILNDYVENLEKFDIDHTDISYSREIIDDFRPSDFIVNLTEVEKNMVSDNKLRYILKNNPRDVKRFIVDFTS